MSGHTQSQMWRSKARRLQVALEQAKKAADDLPNGWDADIPLVREHIRMALVETLRMVRGANAMVKKDLGQDEWSG